MCLSVFYAQIMGIYLFLVSLAMLVHPVRFKKTMNEFLNHQPMVTFSGAMSLVLGLVVILTHNVWISEWPVVVTIVGWLMFLQGIYRIFWPEHFQRSVKDLISSKRFNVWVWFWLLVGIYLIWAGFYQN